MSKSHHEQRGDARTKTPERHQVEMQFLSLDQWLDKDHRVRTVWEYVKSLDLSEIYDSIKARSGTVRHNAIEPRILFALWLFATVEGITSARRIADLTTRDIPYMWICGHVGVNYHRLADFRTEHGDLLERCLTDEWHLVFAKAFQDIAFGFVSRFHQAIVWFGTSLLLAWFKPVRSIGHAMNHDRIEQALVERQSIA